MNRRNAISSQSEYSVIHGFSAANAASTPTPTEADAADGSTAGDVGFERYDQSTTQRKRPYSDSLTERIEHLAAPKTNSSAKDTIDRYQIAEAISQLDNLLSRQSVLTTSHEPGSQPNFPANEPQ
ncbi:hypothetical protein BV898_11862 [Hypsibius exemplaris]|uniref:Uncharacterized protein n=1 Tax=Hypsibius exemplaris TaxID=2072580 RepID=A0A1W0WFL2_HYPEX|nr:hypothetical protein BV898_11862 [Hypsibius exemplaris]